MQRIDETLSKIETQIKLRRQQIEDIQMVLNELYDIRARLIALERVEIDKRQ